MFTEGRSNFDEEERSRARILLERCLKRAHVRLVNYNSVIFLLRWSRSAAFSPGGAYDLSTSTGLSIDGLLLTYTIVLLQFKFSEAP